MTTGGLSLGLRENSPGIGPGSHFCGDISCSVHPERPRALKFVQYFDILLQIQGNIVSQAPKQHISRVGAGQGLKAGCIKVT